MAITVTLVCSCGCETQFERTKGNVRSISGLHFLSPQHCGAYRAETYLQDMCGSFIGVAKEYLDGLTVRGYKSVGSAKAALCPFFLFLTEHSVSNLEHVTPKTITTFLSWADDVDYKNAGHNLSAIASFFKWCNVVGYRKSGCPIVMKWHGKKKAQHLPRPYSKEEMDLIWRFAKERGNSRVRAILAIGEESGLRIGEICRLKFQDIDLIGQRLFVGLPNKTDCEAWVPFSDKVARYIPEWLNNRSSECDHDYLFHNSLDDPLKELALHRECCRIFCVLYTMAK